MKLLGVPPLIMASIAFYVACYHILIHIRRRAGSEDLAFSLTCLAVGFYNICCVGNYNSSFPEQGAEWQRMQLLSLAILAIALLNFVLTYTGFRLGKLRLGIYGFFLICGGLQLLDRSDLTWRLGSPLVKQFALPGVGWEITYQEVAQGRATDVEATGLLVFFVFLYWVSLYYYAYKDARRGAWLLFAVTFFLVAICEDVMVSAGFYPFVYTIEYGFIGMVLVMAYAMSGQLVEATHDRLALHQSETELAEKGRFLESVVNLSPDILYIYDLVSKKNIYSNDGIHAVLGYSPDEIRAMGESLIRMLMDPDDFQAYAQNILPRYATARDGEEIRNQYRMRHQNGSWRTLESNEIIYTRQADGSPRQILGVIRDITERQQAEEERQFLEDQLRQREKITAIGQLAGGIAHDFNNQLGGIMGYADMLVNRLDDPHLNRFAQNIVMAATRASDLTKQLLAFGRKGKYLNVPMDTHRIILEVVELMKRSIDKRIEIKLHLDATPSLVVGDPTQLQNALLNLGLNARDAMPKGGELRFETKNEDIPPNDTEVDLVPGRYVRISVIDTGVGMDSATQRRLFEPFFTTKEVGKGTGLGLPSVYGTIKNHGGAIRVSSKLGQGSAFHLYLPAGEEEDSVEAAAAEELPKKFGQGGHILLVDDEPVILNLGRDILSEMGFQVTACADPLASLELYRKIWAEIDLVILDMVMPKLGGRDLFLAMREVNPDIKAILSSGFSIDGEPQDVLDDGIRVFLQKPFRQEGVAKALHSALTEINRPDL